MTTIFIGGSRAISRLNGLVRTKLDDFISRKCRFVIGDANGADRAVQQYLADRGYRSVLVFCMNQCRNNVGRWPIRRIESQSSRRDFTYYAKKDLAMALEAKCALMLWDGKSKGTLNNVNKLVSLGKKVLLYIAPAKIFRKLSNLKDLEDLLGSDDLQLARANTRRPHVSPASEQDQLLLLP